MLGRDPRRGTSTESYRVRDDVSLSLSLLTDQYDEGDAESGVEVEGGGAVRIVKLGRLLHLIPVDFLQ